MPGGRGTPPPARTNRAQVRGRAIKRCTGPNQALQPTGAAIPALQGSGLLPRPRRLSCVVRRGRYANTPVRTDDSADRWGRRHSVRGVGVRSALLVRGRVQPPHLRHPPTLRALRGRRRGTRLLRRLLPRSRGVGVPEVIAAVLRGQSGRLPLGYAAGYGGRAERL